VKPVSLIGIPFNLASDNPGVEKAPAMFGQLQLKERLESVGLDIRNDHVVELPFSDPKIGDKHLKYAKEVVMMAEKTAEVVKNEITKGHRVVAFGGDHSITLGTVSGASAAVNGDLGVIYIDAHGDMNTDKTSPSGNIHGMPLAAVMGFGNPLLTNIYQKGTKIKKEHMIHIGSKDLDPGEEELIRQENLVIFGIHDLLTFGLSPLWNMITNLSKNVLHIWVSVDMDAIDREFAPGVGMPNIGGLSYREIAAITKYIGKSCNVIGLDIVEYNPDKDVDFKTGGLARELIAKLLGTDYNWYMEYLSHHKV
jgi:arginase